MSARMFIQQVVQLLRDLPALTSFRVSYVSDRISVDICGTTDADVRAFASALGMARPVEHRHDGRRWTESSAVLEGAWVNVIGGHADLLEGGRVATTSTPQLPAGTDLDREDRFDDVDLTRLTIAQIADYLSDLAHRRALIDDPYLGRAFDLRLALVRAAAQRELAIRNRRETERQEDAEDLADPLLQAVAAAPPTEERR